MIEPLSVEKAWEALNYVGAQYEERNTARALALAAHDDACGELNAKPLAFAAICGHGYSCPKRQAIERLGK